MKHSEKIYPAYGRLVSVLLLSVIAATAVIFTLTKHLPYSSIIQLVLFVLIIAGVYLLIKNLLTPYEYSFDEEVLIIARGEGVYRQLIAGISEDMILEISRSYRSEYNKLNAYPLFSVKKERLWRILCNDGETNFSVFIAPSNELLEILNDLYPDKFKKEADNE
ncbi:MAG: hypothetical protein IKM04_08495 [Clostridia bacterium]|nr:hypothetical protein [Clostridia bacterium]